jgi:hypothetical protein
MCVVAEVCDEVCCDTQDDEGTAQVQGVGGSEKEARRFVRADCRRAIVAVCGGGTSHC